MKIPFWQVDAFTNRRFAGNPAGVCVLDAWLDDAVMQAIGAENNLSETAFVCREPSGWRIRWFTPTVEVDLCGHATLAAAHVLFETGQLDEARVEFMSKSGPLAVSADGPRRILDFPSRPPVPVVAPADLLAGLGAPPLRVLKARDFVAVYASEADVAALRPDFAALGRLDCVGVAATARGDEVDFVSRFFAPTAGVDEDPVTGSAHCTLAPYWAEQLGRSTLEARQISARGGELRCEVRGDRVTIGGHAVTYLEGCIHV